VLLLGPAGLAYLPLQAFEEALGNGRSGRLGGDGLGILGVGLDVLGLLTESEEARLSLLLGGLDGSLLGGSDRGNLRGGLHDGGGLTCSNSVDLVLDLLFDGSLGDRALFALAEESADIGRGGRLTAVLLLLGDGGGIDDRGSLGDLVGSLGLRSGGDSLNFLTLLGGGLVLLETGEERLEALLGLGAGLLGLSLFLLGGLGLGDGLGNSGLDYSKSA